MAVRAQTVTILFTDLVSSTELLQRAGDERAQRIFKAHHRLLSEAVQAHGGHEVKWLGDGLMVAFDSARDAAQCALAMQQASRRPAAGERLQIRVGLHVGDAFTDESDYFGTPVVVARRLCDTCEGGQIIASDLVVRLLDGRTEIAFDDLGALALKGIETPVHAHEVRYEHDPLAMLAVTPFVGRDDVLATLTKRLEEARAGKGSLVMLVGEPGIGKTRTAEEFCASARQSGAIVLWGRCYEAEWAPPYAPFAEAIDTYGREAAPDDLRLDLGFGAAPIARLAPSLRERYPDVGEPTALQPDEERFRLLDAVLQLLIALSRRVPAVIVLDDLHWADRGTIAMLHHVARFAPKHALLILGTYRDAEVDRKHPLQEALASLRREIEYQSLALKGLAAEHVGELIETISEQPVSAELVRSISDETDGNPFFIREVLIHLIEERKLVRDGGVWSSSARTIAELGIPEGVRQVIKRRVSRLSDAATRLLSAASAFQGGFRFDVVVSATGISEDAALDAIDEATEAQLLKQGQEREHYEFSHALIRQTLYEALNPSRQIRLHRQIAEAIEASASGSAASYAPELAYQYHRSAALPGAERGVSYALGAADAAQRSAAWDETAALLGIALDLMPPSDGRSLEVRERQALALLTALRLDEGDVACKDVAKRTAEAQGNEEAARFLHRAQSAAFLAGGLRTSWSLAEDGMRYVDERRDAVWCDLFRVSRWGRMAVEPDSAGIGLPIDDAQFDEWVAALAQLSALQRIPLFATRGEAMAALAGLDGTSRSDADATVRRGRTVLANVIGDYRRALSVYDQMAIETERDGRVAGQILALSMKSRLHTVLGEFVDAGGALDRGTELAGRLAQTSRQAQLLIAATDELRYATGEETELSLELLKNIVTNNEPELRWAYAGSCAALARIMAMAGQADEAMTMVQTLPDIIARTPVWEGNYPRIACDAAAALWFAGRSDCIDAIESGVRDRVLAADYRYPMQDARTALARLCVIRGQYDEAARWFQDARRVTDEQGALPCRAIVDLDEALMLTRRGGAGDVDRARKLLSQALEQMRRIGMTGWERRAEATLAATEA